VLIIPVTTAWPIFRLQIEERPPIWRVAANKLNSSCGQPTRGGTPAWGLGEGVTTPPYKTALLRNTHMQDASSGDKTIRRQTTSPLKSPGGSVSRGGITQNTKGDEIRHLVEGGKEVEGV